MRKMLLFALAFAPFLLSAQQVAKSLTAANGTKIGFLEFRPSDYSATDKHPLIISLHGISERGNGTTDIGRVSNVGIPKYIKYGGTMRFYFNGKWESFVVLSPQLSTVYGDWQTFYIDEMINYAIKNLKVDPNRIILTGLSLGGGGVWKYASSSSTAASKLAAIVPVCGTCQMSNAKNIAGAKLAVWAFHATNDTRVSPSCTINAVNNIANANPLIKPLIKLYSSGGHVIWDMAYDSLYKFQNPTVWEWFLGQNKSLPVNQLPIASAGSNVSLSASVGKITLSGTGSRDPDGSIVRYIWRKVSGPTSGVLGALNQATLSISSLTVSGTYQYELTVVDNRGCWSKDTVTVTVSAGAPLPNVAPVSKAGSDQTITLPTNYATLNGSGSVDSDGSISSYNWSQVSGPSTSSIASPTSVSTKVSNLIAGKYTYRLKTTDNKGAYSTDDILITVNAAPATNQAPVARAGSDISITLPVNSASLSGSTSADSDGSISSYSWSQVSGPSTSSIAAATSANTTVSNLVAGTYTYQLKVTDNGGLSATDQVLVVVKTATSSLAPVANAGADVFLTSATNTVTLNGSASTGNIVRYYWSRVSGTSSYSTLSKSGSIWKLSNVREGIYVFRLTVTDDKNRTSYDDVKVTVSTSGTAPSTGSTLQANAGADVTRTSEINTVTLDGAASTGNIVKYAWYRESGTSSYSTISKSGSVWKLSNVREGVYVFRLVVTDDKGKTSADDVTVTVSTSGTAPATGSTLLQANAGPDVTRTSEINTVTLDGAASTGNIVKYAWYRESGTSSYSTISKSGSVWKLSNVREGVYVFRLVVTDDKGKTSIDDVTVSVHTSTAAASPKVVTATEVTPSTAAPAIVAKESLKVYPNPAVSNLTVNLNSRVQGNSIVAIYDVSGKLVKKLTISKTSEFVSQTLDVSDLRPGMYHIQASIDNKTTLVTKFIKQ